MFRTTFSENWKPQSSQYLNTIGGLKVYFCSPTSQAVLNFAIPGYTETSSYVSVLNTLRCHPGHIQSLDRQLMLERKIAAPRWPPFPCDGFISRILASDHCFLSSDSAVLGNRTALQGGESLVSSGCYSLCHIVSKVTGTLCEVLDIRVFSQWQVSWALSHW